MIEPQRVIKWRKEGVGNRYSRNWSDITSHDPIRMADATMSMAGNLFALWDGMGVIAEAAKVVIKIAR